MKNIKIKSVIQILIGLVFTCSLITVKAQNLQISGGNNFSASLCSDGKVYAWGKNDAGQIGRNASNVKYPAASYSTPQPVYLPVSNSLTMKQVDAGSGNTGIALACDGSVWTWGGNCGNGNIGNGTNGGSCSGSPTDGTNYYSAMQRVVGGQQGGAFLSNIIYINASTRTSFAVESTGKVLAWGNNADGDLGQGVASNTNIGGSANTYAPYYVKTAAGVDLTNIKIVEGSDYGGYALANDGYVYSWGFNSNQDLGRTPTPANQYYATRVQAWDYATGTVGDLKNIVRITGGDTHGLAIDADGNLWSWGGDWGPGQRGWGATSSALPYATKVVAPGTPCALNQWKIGPWITDVVDISAGQQHSIALMADGRVVTFGNNSSGQLGIGSTSSSGCPVYVKTSAGVDLTNIVSISDGDLWSFALTSAGQVYVWGENGNGELGIPGDNADKTYATLNPAIPTTCTGSLLPCPKADLGPDILKCEGVSETLLAGANGDTYRYSWYYGSSATGPWTLIGAANQAYAGGAGAQLTVTTPRYYRVVITDTRAYVADNCGPCVASEDIIRVQDRTPPLATSQAGTCGGDVCFEINSTGAIDNTAFDWYANQSTPTKLNTSGYKNPFCTAASNLTLNGSNYEIWVDDKRTFNATVGPTTAPCSPTGGTSGSKYQQQIVVYRDVTITSVKVYYRTYNVTAGFDAANVKVYSNDPNKNSSSNDGVNALTGQVSASFSFPRTSTTFQEFTMTGLNLALTGSASGTKYWLEISGLSDGEFGEFVCTGAGGYPYSDNIASEDAVILRGSTESAQVIQQADYKALGFNWNFTYQSGYPCGRFKVTAPNGSSACLPVDFIYFNGENHDRCNQLKWATASEKNSKNYQVLKSIDGVNWTTIAVIPAAGNTSSISSYSYNDCEINSSSNYYKLIQVDNDGSTYYSEMIQISTVKSILKVVPNPNNGEFKLYVIGNQVETPRIFMTDALGRIVYQTTATKEMLSSGTSLDLQHLSKGVYMLHVSDDFYNEVVKVIVE